MEKAQMETSRNTVISHTVICQQSNKRLCCGHFNQFSYRDHSFPRPNKGAIRKNDKGNSVMSDKGVHETMGDEDDGL